MSEKKIKIEPLRLRTLILRIKEIIMDGIKQIAGFMDGDGCIGIYRVKRRRSSSWHYILQVIFAQSRIDKMKILKDIQSKYKGCIYKTKRKKGNFQGYALRMSGNGAKKLIDDILPYLRVREKQAKLAIGFMNYRKENSGQYCSGKLPIEHTEFYEKCRKKMNYYNRRGSTY